MAQITVCLTNWKRPDNLRLIIEQLRQQSTPIQIFLWNNGEPFNHLEVDWYVNSSINKICAPRWFMAANAATEFVCIQDDDLLLTDNYVFSDMLNIAKTTEDTRIIGPTGVRLLEGKTYRDADHLYSFRCNEVTDKPCDIIKGSLMLMRTSSLRNCVDLNIFKYYREEDIVVSALMAGGKLGQHLCLTSFGNRFQSLGNDSFALWRDEGHMDARHDACQNFFSGKPAG